MPKCLIEFARYAKMPSNNVFNFKTASNLSIKEVATVRRCSFLGHGWPASFYMGDIGWGLTDRNTCILLANGRSRSVPMSVLPLPAVGCWSLISRGPLSEQPRSSLIFLTRALRNEDSRFVWGLLPMSLIMRNEVDH